MSRNPEIKKVYSLIDKVAKSNASVLIQGETGTGKEMIAGAIQAQSNRVNKTVCRCKLRCSARTTAGK